MTGISQQFCVRWNSHLGSLGAAFPQLLAGQQFLDVTLACDGHQVHCHRLVLAACSSYFESLLSENPCKHPIIILPKDIKLWEIHALVDFMYKGQVNVSQAGLPQLLKCAETLQIRGLCGTESSLNEVANGKIDRDPNLLSSTCSPNFNFTSMFASNLLNANYQSDDEPQQPFRQQHADLQRSAFADTAKSTTNHRSSETLVKNKNAHKNAHASDKTTKDHCNATLNTTKPTLKRMSDHESAGSNSELNIKCEEIDSDANAADDGMDDDLDEHSNSKQSEYTMQQNDAIVVDNDLLVVCDGSKETAHNGSDSNVQIDTEIFPANNGNDTMVENNDDADADADADDDIDDPNSITITQNDCVDDVNAMCYSPSWSFTGEVNAVRVEEEVASREFDCDLTELPTSLKFNRNTMSIFVKRTTAATSSTIAKPGLTKRPSTINQTDFSDDSENIVCSPNFGAIRREATNGASRSTGNDHHFETFNTHHSDDGYTNMYQSMDNDDELRTATRADRRSDRLMALLKYKDPLRSAVVLRSPRGNQPRTYTTDALYAALMDVKSGESIYRASQIHSVPRKTLRNWMKRWHIKSVYPMPYQLKKAAEKKRQTGQQLNETRTATSSSTQAELSPEMVDTNDY